QGAMGPRLLGEEAHVIDPAGLPNDAVFPDPSREELLEAERDADHFFHVVPEGRLIETDSDGGDLGSGPKKALVNAARPETRVGNVAQQLVRAGSQAGDGVDGIARANGSGRAPHELEEPGGRAPGASRRRRRGDVETLLA